VFRVLISFTPVPLGFLSDNIPLGESIEGFPVQVAPGLPFGIVFIGGKWSERMLLGCGYALEQSMQVRARRRPFDDAVPRSQLPGFSRQTDEAKTPRSHPANGGRLRTFNSMALLVVISILATLLLIHRWTR